MTGGVSIFKKYVIIYANHSVNAIARSPTKFWGDRVWVGFKYHALYLTLLS